MNGIFEDIHPRPNGISAAARLARETALAIESGGSIRCVARRARVGEPQAAAAMHAAHDAVLAEAQRSILGHAGSAAAVIERRGWLDIAMVGRWNDAEDSGEVPPDLRRCGEKAWARIMRLQDKAERAAAKAPSPPPPRHAKVIDTGL